ncbi:YceI family protein [Motilibacter deserti]|uniref:YceI family protein n=1 Tax=Motilibacter deserti TaxID=2714956 RepID=A0ABX0GRS1_9ACTN|nr:YceI family protein [Motilibacter deserti]NHC13178.1 YceI family protein [Motilibacter deserti]
MTSTDFDAPTSAIEDLTGDYTIDVTHSRVGFVARHAMVTKVRGHFGEFEGSAHLDAADPAKSSAKLSIKVASVDTNQAQRDEHLRTGDFFEAETYPEITFVSTSTEKLDDENFRLNGDLTIKGVTRPVSVDFEFTGTAKDPFGNLRAGFEGKTTIKRSDWGLTYNAALETGGVLVSDKIVLEFDISAIKNAA